MCKTGFAVTHPVVKNLRQLYKIMLFWSLTIFRKKRLYIEVEGLVVVHMPDLLLCAVRLFALFFSYSIGIREFYEQKNQYIYK